MSKKCVTPELRFAGFNEDWEQKKLASIVERVVRKNQDLISELPLTISAQYGLIDQNEFFDKRIASKDVTGYYLIYKGEFAYNKSTSSDAPWGAIKRLDRYKNGVLSTLYIVFKIKDETTVSSDYLAVYYDTTNWYKGIKAIAAEGARNHGLLNIAPSDFFDSQLFLPTDRTEQQKIGSYFLDFDKLISNQEQKLEKLMNLKQSCLQKMFPKEGEDVPEIRFPEFSGPWNRTKLEEYIAVSKQKNIMDCYKKEDVLSVSGDFGIVNQIEFQGRSFAGASVSNYGVVETGDIVYTKSPLKANPYGIIKENLGDPGIVSTLYAVYKPKETVAPLFVQTYFNLDSRMNKYMRPLVNKGAKNDMKVSAENALKGYVCFPELDEQMKIAKFLTEIDKMIICYQRELEMLRRIKQGCLQKMFV